MKSYVDPNDEAFDCFFQYATDDPEIQLTWIKFGQKVGMMSKAADPTFHKLFFSFLLPTDSDAFCRDDRNQEGRLEERSSHDDHKLSHAFVE